MSQERLSMRKISEVLRLKWTCGLSNRAVARSCRISHSTVSEYLVRAEQAGLRWPLPEDLDEDGLYRLLFPEKVQAAERLAKPLPDWEQVRKELKKRSVTLRLLWEEYREGHPDGYGYSQYCELYRQYVKKLDPPMRQNHKAGEKLFVDYAGDTIPITNPETGEVWQAQIFVAVQGASSYTYAEAQASQELPNWIGGHVRALAYFGGVTQVIVPDNLKQGVKSPCWYDPDLNQTYLEMAQHYEVAVIPTRVRKPRDKAKVEVAVQVVERWILARLRNRTFFSLAELNRAIRKLLEDLNNRKMEHLDKSRRELFEELDRPALRPLPERPYEYATWKAARVNIDYHVELEGHYYSVPHTLVHEEVELRFTGGTVEVLHRGQRVASHARRYQRGQHTTNPEHMPKAHRQHLEWTPSRFIRWGAGIGPATGRLVEAILHERPHPEQGYRSCLGILRLERRYGRERLEAACARALAVQARSYRDVDAILKHGLDRLPPLVAQGAVASAPLVHENVRGAAYYQ
ncbi:MAG TPA: IS21 family transposase [Dehalococcoidia bacterium]|nr:IS21 family transposase [Dehalococcoidia bacterium]